MVQNNKKNVRNFKNIINKKCECVSGLKRYETMSF